MSETTNTRSTSRWELSATEAPSHEFDKPSSDDIFSAQDLETILEELKAPPLLLSPYELRRPQERGPVAAIGRIVRACYHHKNTPPVVTSEQKKAMALAKKREEAWVTLKNMADEKAEYYRLAAGGRRPTSRYFVKVQRFETLSRALEDSKKYVVIGLTRGKGEHGAPILDHGAAKKIFKIFRRAYSKPVVRKITDNKIHEIIRACFAHVGINATTGAIKSAVQKQPKAISE
jgi:hypothetical protein